MDLEDIRNYFIENINKCEEYAHFFENGEYFSMECVIKIKDIKILSEMLIELIDRLKE